MTFDANIQADYGTALAELRDKVSGMSNWSVKHDSSGGAAALAKGDEIVLTSADPAEDLLIGVDDAIGGLYLQHGKAYNSGNTAWDDRFTYDPHATKDFYDPEGSTQFDSPMTVYPYRANMNESTISMSATGHYWLEYTDGGGFVFWWQREAGDGDDAELFIGMSKINEAWDYTGAAEREAQWALSFGDSNKGTQRLIHLSESGKTNQNPESDNQGEKTHVKPSNTYVARGQVNPDNNFANYPLTNHIVSSAQYTNVNGNAAVIGDFDTVLDDQSGSSTGHRDLIQDDQGNSIYTILKRSGTPHIAVRMD